jgi:hypothetical protein
VEAFEIPDMEAWKNSGSPEETTDEMKLLKEF